MKMKSILAIVLATTMLAACTQPPAGAGRSTGGIAKQDIGTVLGGVGGAFAGSAFGKGNGRLVATGAGALLGGLLGSSIGRSLDEADAAYYAQTTQQALETAPSGQSMPWKNPDSGNYGYVVPAAPYQTADGTYCREFSQTIVVGGKKQQGYGRACRQPDGSWQIVQ